MEDNKYVFTVTQLSNGSPSSSYIVYGNEVTTLDGVWASQKCWFMRGSHVVVMGPDGSSKRFVKE